MKSHINSFNLDNDIPVKEELIIKVPKKKHSNKNNKKDKRIIVIGLFILFLVIFISSMFEISKWYLDSKKIDNNVDIIEEIVEIEEIIDTEDNINVELVNEPEEPESDYWYYIKFPLIQVDFNELLKKNSDTVAWINVNNTNINYPVVQANDNEYYLTRAYDKKWNSAGWVFMDYRNSGTLNDKNTILYAHSRLDDTMFGSLSETLKSKWYKNKDNHIIKMSTPNENSLWQIFSVYRIETENYYITTEFDTNEEYLNFLNTLKSRSKHNFNVSLNEFDSILTLSTCASKTERTVVHAKKIKKSERTS